MDLKKLKAEAEFNANLVTEINALRKKALSKLALSELWVFQEKVDMKVSAFSFNSSLLIFGYL